MTRAAPSIILFLAGALAPAGGVKASTLDYQRINAGIAISHVTPRYRKLAAATRALENKANEFCERRNSETLTVLRAAFHQTMDAWQGIQHIRFGPVEEQNRYHRIQFWPDKRNMIGRHLSRLLAKADTGALTPHRFRATSVAVQGLPALERLLFVDTHVQPVMANGGEASFRCALVEAIAGNLAVIGASIHAEWTHPGAGYLNAIENTGPDSPVYRNAREAALDLHGAFATMLQVVAELKLQGPLGQNAARSKPRRSESWRSERSLRNVVVNLEAALALYAGESEGGGFREALRAADPEDALHTRIYEPLRNAIDLLRQVPLPLYKAVKDPAGRTKLQLAVTQLQFLLHTVRNEFAGTLKLGLGFNALDGD